MVASSARVIVDTPPGALNRARMISGNRKV